MTLSQRHPLHGRLQLELKDAQGRLVDFRQVDNMILDGGKELLARYFTGEWTPTKDPLSIAVGLNNTPPQPGDYQLGEEVSQAQATCQVTATMVRVTATFLANPIAAGVQPLCEAGIQIPVQPGQVTRGGVDMAYVLYNRVVFPTVNKGADMELTLTWEVSF